MTMITEGGCWEHFDYDQMAEVARRERDRLHSRLMDKRAKGPGPGDDIMIWRRDDSMLYLMYLEQRKLAKEFEERARRRREYAA